MVCDTHINFLWLLFILVGKICPPSFETQSSSCDYIRVSGRLIYFPKCLLDLKIITKIDFLCQRMRWFLQCFVMLSPGC